MHLARGCRGTLKRRPADCAGPPPIWMHGRNRVSGQPALMDPHPDCGAGAIMRPVFRCFLRPRSVYDGNGSTSNGWTGRHALGVTARALYMKV